MSYQRFAPNVHSLAIWLLSAYLFYCLLLFYAIPELMAYTGPGVPLGMRLRYTEDEAFMWLSSLRDDGSFYYLYFYSALDMVFPALYGYALFRAIRYLLQLTAQRWRGAQKLRWLAALPVIGAAFDYLENCSIIAMVVGFPEFFESIAAAASLGTSLKTVCMAAAMLTFLALLPTAAISRTRG